MLSSQIQTTRFYSHQVSSLILRLPAISGTRFPDIIPSHLSLFCTSLRLPNGSIRTKNYACGTVKTWSSKTEITEEKCALMSMLSLCDIRDSIDTFLKVLKNVRD